MFRVADLSPLTPVLGQLSNVVSPRGQLHHGGALCHSKPRRETVFRGPQAPVVTPRSQEEFSIPSIGGQLLSPYQHEFSIPFCGQLFLGWSLLSRYLLLEGSYI